MATDLQGLLELLTSQPSTENPFLSVYLDWTPDGNGNRQSLRNLDEEFATLEARIKAENGNLESFYTDQDRIKEYLEDEAPADAKGLAIFACDADSVWEPVPLQVPVETQIVVDRFPHTFNLARIIDDYETYAVVLADSQESRILVVSMNEAEQVAETEARDEIRRFEAGGWAQMLFQRRTQEVIKAHTKDIADRLGRMMKRYNVEHVIIVGNDSVKGTILGSLPQQIKDRMVDFIKLDLSGSLASILEVTEPMMREVEQQQEQDDVESLQGEVGREGLGVVGARDTALALTKGQVMTLLMLQSYTGAGVECPNCGSLNASLRANCPYDGTEMQSADLREAFTRRAMQTSANIQIVEANDYLEQNGGVGALLRYRDDEKAQTQAVGGDNQQTS